MGANAVDKAVKQAETEPAHDEKKKVLLLVLYVILFALSLLTVAKKVPFPVTLGVTFVCIAILDRKTLG